MNRVILVKAFFVGVSAVGLWVTFIIAYLFNRQEICTNVTFRTGIRDKLLISSPDNDNEGFDAYFEPDIAFHGLNKHSWERYCQSHLEQLCNYPIFPKAPDKRTYVPNADIDSEVAKFDEAIRLLGYVQPNASGDHQFLVASNGLAEVWLSPNANWRNAKRIAYIRPQYLRSPLKRMSFEGIKSQISDSVNLVARRKCYFEVIYIQSQDNITRGKHFQIAWKRPDSRRFEIIDRKFFSLYTEDMDKAKLKVLDDELPEALTCVQSRTKSANIHMRPETLPHLKRTAVDKALPTCEYKPSYLLDPANLPRDFKHYRGVHKHVQKTYTYPFQSLNGVITPKKIHKAFIAENPLNEKEALSVITKYIEALKRTNSG